MEDLKEIHVFFFLSNSSSSSSHPPLPPPTVKAILEAQNQEPRQHDKWRQLGRQDSMQTPTSVQYICSKAHKQGGWKGLEGRRDGSGVSRPGTGRQHGMIIYTVFTPAVSSQRLPTSPPPPPPPPQPQPCPTSLYTWRNETEGGECIMESYISCTATILPAGLL